MKKEGNGLILSHLIEEGVVSFLDVGSRDVAIKTLVDALVTSKGIIDRKSFFEAVIKREEIVSTGIGMGVAIPHAKLAVFDHFFLAVGLQKGKEGINWGALDGIFVRLIFMIGGPANRQTDYLKTLSHLTTALKDEDRRQKLLNSKTREDVIALFKGC